MLISNIKKLILGNPLGNYAYKKFHSIICDQTYYQLRESYFSNAINDPLAYDQFAHIERCMSKISKRGYEVKTATIGDLHTYCYIPANWPHQCQIFSATTYFGRTTRFNYVSLGVTLNDFIRNSKNDQLQSLKRDICKKFVSDVIKVNKEHPIDWILAYALPWDMDPDAILEIQQQIGVPIVNISLDDKNWWNWIHTGDKKSGLKQMIPYYDLTWTSSSNTLPWHWGEGGSAIYLPEGVNSDYFRPLISENISYDVGFVGNNFGYREDIISYLRKANINVVCHGSGWPAGLLSDKDMLKFFNKCRINLGIGDFGYSRWLTNLKGRDFEIPSVGKGLYLTTYNHDLSKNFSISREISCYRGVDELIDLIRYYLIHEDERNQMSISARKRCILDHQWKHRIENLLMRLGVI